MRRRRAHEGRGDLFGAGLATAPIAACVAATESRSPGWCDLAVDRVRAFVNAEPAGQWTVEQIRAGVADSLPAPSDLRAWGGVARIATARGVIAFADQIGRADSSNGAFKPVYRRGPHAG